ncbi:MAG: hypothetical protein AB7O04_14015, partial [Hyphomonadaceae bacterium]
PLIAENGLCHDGLGAHGLNLNTGAESILALQSATLAMRALTKAPRTDKGAGARSSSEPLARANSRETHAAHLA